MDIIHAVLELETIIIRILIEREHTRHATLVEKCHVWLKIF